MMTIGIVQLLDVLQSARFTPSGWRTIGRPIRTSPRAVDALGEQIDTLVEAVAVDHDRAYRSLSFRVNAIGQEHRVTFAKSGRDIVVLVDDNSDLATLALTARAYPHIAAALRRWADRVEAVYTE